MSGQEIVFINGSKYTIQEPTIHQRLEADIFYEELAYDLSFEGWITQEHTLSILTRMKLWSEDLTKEVEETEKNINDLKISLYRNQFDSTKSATIRKSLVQQKNKYEKLLTQRALLDHTTVENYINTLKTQYIIAISIYDEDGNNVYSRKSFWYDDPYILLLCLKKLDKNRPSINELRELARTEPWRSYWNVAKDRVFGKPIAEWTSMQRTLALYSKMYDNTYSHPECPNETVINDDDMFDGWVLVQEEKRKQAIVDKNVDNVIKGKSKNAAELFIPVDNVSDAKKIVQMNDLDTRIKLAQRDQQIKNTGRVEEGKFKDQQIEFRNTAQKAILQRARGGRK